MKYIIAFFLLNMSSYQNASKKCERTISLEVMEEVLNILSSEEKWTKEGAFDDDCESEREQYSLACALKKAQENIRGEYKNRSCEMESVRVMIAFKHFKRLEFHPIHGFNKHEKTTYEDVIHLLELVKEKYE